MTGEADWLRPEPLAFPDHRPPSPVFGVPYELLLWCQLYSNAVSLVRFLLAHPELPVPGHARPVIGEHALGTGRSRAARERRERLIVELNRRHIAQIVSFAWPILRVLAERVQLAARG